MKNNIIFKILIFLLFSSTLFGQSKNDHFAVKGIVHGNYDGYVYLQYNGVKDSCQIINNKIYFEGKVPLITTGSFVIGKGPTIMTQDFYLENEYIEIEITLSKKTVNKNNYDWVYINSVSGTKASLIEKDYLSFQDKHQKDKNWQQEHYDKIDAIISKYPDHPYSSGLLHLLVWDSVANKSRLKQMYTKLDFKTQDPESSLLLKKHIFGSSKIGKSMMNFELPNQKNVIVKTNQFRGSVLLIDFWASWCAPCRKQIPEIKKLYEKYKNKNLKILTISLDKSQEKWISALEKENMPWDNVIDNREFLSPITREYEIFSIPSSYLIDDKGIIIANDLTILELDEYLNKNLK